MDKEARERMTERLRQDLINAPFLISYPDGISLAVYLVELGYCKLPKDKPLLLNDGEMEEISSIFRYDKASYRKVAQAQREADIKFYS